jgi:hypothetical protein
MKKLLIIFYLLPLFSIAQDFATLKKQADEFYKKGKYKKAAPLYEKAIDLVVTYRQKVKNLDWQQLSIAAAETNFRVYHQQKLQYPHVKYGADGEALKEKIDELKTQGVNYVFTYGKQGGGSVSSYLVTAPASKVAVNVGSSWDRRYLVWADNDGVFMQPFDNFNVYKPVKITHRDIVDICQKQFDQVLKDEIIPLKLKDSEQSTFKFIFYTDKESYLTKSFDEGDLLDPLRKGQPAFYVTRNTYFKQDLANFAKNYVTPLGQLALLLVKETGRNFPKEQ